MSHYATISCNCLDDVKAKTLQKALKRINSKFSIKMLKDVKYSIPQLGGNAVIMEGNKPTSIRMDLREKADGKIGLTLCGEFYRTGFDLKSFSEELQKNYNTVKVEDYAKAENFQPVYRKVEENGEIVMRFRVAS